MSAESKYDKFERDLLNATAAKRTEDETEVEKTVDDLLKSTLAGMGIDPEKRRQILREAEESTKAEPPKPPPIAVPKADVVDLKPQDKSARSESLPWIKEPPRPVPSVTFQKPESPVFREKAEMPFPSLKKDEPFLEEYGKEKKRTKSIVPIIVGGLVVVIGVVAFLIFSGSKEKASAEVKSVATGIKRTEAMTGPAEAVSGTSTLASKPGMETASLSVLPTKTIPETKTAVEKQMPAPEKRPPIETSSPAPDTSVAPILPSDAAGAKVQEIKPTRTAPADVAPPTTIPEASPAAKPKVILGQLVPIGQVDTPPVLVKRTEPAYPPLAQRMRIQGSVKINALIDETGSVIRTEVLQASSGGSASGFEKASQDAVIKWKFKPAVKEGTYVKVWMPVLVTFNLK